MCVVTLARFPLSLFMKVNFMNPSRVEEAKVAEEIGVRVEAEILQQGELLKYQNTRKQAEILCRGLRINYARCYSAILARDLRRKNGTYQLNGEYLDHLDAVNCVQRKA